VDFSNPRNLIVAAVTLTAGAGDLTLGVGSFSVGGIGTATFGAIFLNWLLSGRETASTADSALGK
jgi:xanthine/uracil permease